LLAEGLERILVEGGGGLAAAFLEAGLVDELRLTITPWLLGGDAAPSIADAGHRFEPPAHFEYVDVDAREDEVFVTLRRKDDTG
jgi:riboflavin biosynthesis pyrimidine reductase